MDAPGEIIVKADAEMNHAEMSEVGSDREDTVDEAPSIVDDEVAGDSSEVCESCTLWLV